MKYLTAHFSITAADDLLLQASRDVLADALSAVGFESFEDSDDGLTGYVRSELLDRDGLAAVCRDFPLAGVTIGYELSEVEDRDWNEPWENAGFAPILTISQSQPMHNLPSASASKPDRLSEQALIKPLAWSCKHY